MSEITWRPHPVHTSYEASSDGRIRSLKSGGRILKPSRRRPNDRYQHVVVDGVTIRVHTFVCEAFHGLKPSPEMWVRHLNDIGDDNRPENLVWGTPSQNQDDMRDNRYHGPRDTLTRFQAGETVTWRDALQDESDWVVVRIEPTQLRQLREMLSPPAELRSGRQLPSGSLRSCAHRFMETPSTAP